MEDSRGGDNHSFYFVILKDAVKLGLGIYIGIRCLEAL
jgi:hypothetical protein